MKKTILLFVLLLTTLSVVAQKQDTCGNHWMQDPKMYCSPYEGSKWVILQMVNLKHHRFADSVVWTVNNRALDTDTVLFEAGLHPIKAKVYSKDKACIKNFNLLVPFHQVKASFEMSDSVVCEGEIVEFINTSGPEASSSVWNFGDGTKEFRGKHPLYQFDYLDKKREMPIHYFITLEVKDRMNCRDTAYKAIQVYKNRLKGYLMVEESATDSDLFTIEYQRGSLFNMNTIMPSVFQWSTGDTTSSIKVKEGYYWLKTTDDVGCWEVNGIYVRKYVSPPKQQ